MRDACDILRRFAGRRETATDAVATVEWQERWWQSAGRGVTIGLLDTGIDPDTPELRGAHLDLRSFAGRAECDPAMMEHGTYSAALLVGRGAFRGLVPEARLLAGSVVGPGGVAEPGDVARALDWLFSAGAQIVALPLGSAAAYPEIAESIERGAPASVQIYAAAGGRHPQPLLFPARHPRVVAVGAADSTGRMLAGTCRLPRLDLLAPGEDVTAPTGRSGLQPRSGSSVACVVAAAAAALAMSAGDPGCAGS